MNSVLDLLREGAALSTEQMAAILNLEIGEVKEAIQSLQDRHILLGWRPVFNPNRPESNQTAHAVIEVKIRPQVEGGYDRLADRISRFPQVESCYLMSGAYDLLVFMQAESLQAIAAFVFERLAAIDGVVSTSTHFMLRAYKEQGYRVDAGTLHSDKPVVSP
jgi:DNA-binding Lrp family transcriptional regulator